MKFSYLLDRERESYGSEYLDNIAYFLQDEYLISTFLPLLLFLITEYVLAKELRQDTKLGYRFKISAV
jgi:hypothetical protein